MKTVTLPAALCAAFFVAPIQGFADTQQSVSEPPLVLVKDTAKAGVEPTFDPRDFPWDLPEGRTEDVVIPLGNAVLTMPWMDVTKDGDDFVEIIAPEITITEEADGKTKGGATITGAELQIRRLDDTMAVSGIAEDMTISDGDTDEVGIQLDGLDFTLTSSGYELAIQAMEDDADSGSDQMIEAMRALNVALDYSTSSFSMKFNTTEGGNAPFDMVLSSGPSESGLRFGDGRLDMSATSKANAFSVEGPLPVEGDIGLVSYSLSMPVEEAKAPQPMQFGMEISDVSVSDTIWDMVDPQKIFPRSFDQAKLDMTMNIILKESMFDNARGTRGSEALVPVDVTLTALELDGLGLDVSANGEMEMSGEIPKSISAYLSVAGLSEFMANAVEAGFIPQAQAIMGEGIALQFAKEEADGSLTFDVKTDDGMVSINGNRVAPLPQ